MDEADFTSEMQNHGFDLYVNGHVHTLTQYTIDNKGAYVTSGAGAMVLTDDNLGGTPAKDRTMWKGQGKKHIDSLLAGHSYQTVWNGQVSGFTSHTFNDVSFTKRRTLASSRARRGAQGPSD